MSVANLAAALFFSLIFSSVCIAYFTSEMGMSEEIQIVAPLTGLSSYNISSNIETSSNIITGAEWTKQDIGYVLNSNGALLGVKNILTTGTITNNYVINNTVNSNYNIVIYYLNSQNINEISVRPDGLHIPNCNNLGNICIGDLAFFPMQDANRIQHVNVQTAYNKNEKTLTFTFNGESHTVTHMNDLNFNSAIGSAEYYGGIMAYTKGFVLESFKTSNPIGNTTQNPIDQIVSFVYSVFVVLLWTLPESVMPLTLNIILIKTQLTALLICLVVIIRGATG